MSGDQPVVRVVLADDHPMFRFGLRAALDAVPGVEVVGDAADGAELVRLVETLRPDVALTDLAMPGTDGTTAVAEIAARPARPRATPAWCDTTEARWMTRQRWPCPAVVELSTGSAFALTASPAPAYSR